MGATTVNGRVDLPELIILSLAKGWGGAEEYLELLTREQLAGKRRFFIHANRYYDIFRGWHLKRKNTGSALVFYQHCFLRPPTAFPWVSPTGSSAYRIT